MNEKNTLFFQEELFDYMDEYDRVPSEEEIEEMAREQEVDELPIVLKIDKTNKKQLKTQKEMI